MNKLTNDFIMLITGTSENDLAAERAAAAGRPVIHHKLAYVPVYENYEELKKLQLKIRGSAAAAGKKIFAAIDISEWIGHENEEFFIASVKYFHDRRTRMNYIFTVGDHRESEVMGLFIKLRCYLRGVMRTDDTFISRESLAQYIKSRCAEEKASQLVADMIMSDEMKPLRSYPAINNMCYEIRATSKSGVIGLEDVSQYLLSSISLPAMISSDTAAEYANKANELLYKLKESKIA